MYQPGLDFIEAILACFATGIVAVPVQPLQNRRVLPRLTGILSDAGCRRVLTNRATQEMLLQRIPDLDTHLPGVEWLHTDSIPDSHGDDFRRTSVDRSALAFLQYTSGSTGTPKGVMVSHANLLDNEANIQQAFGHNRDTRIAGWLPVYHDMGLVGNIFQPLYLGTPAVLLSPMTFLTSPITWLRAVSDWRATTSGGPSFAYDLCIHRIAEADMEGLDLSSWSVAFNGAEPVRASVIRDFARKFAPYGFREEAFYPCYGLAEATLFVTGSSPQEKPVQLSVASDDLEQHRVTVQEGSDTVLVGCGRTRGSHDVQVVDPDSRVPLPDGRVGEVWISGPSVTGGYWNKPELTASTFHATTADGRGPYLRTGDLGFRHRDEMFITGRLKDLILIRGRNHYPDDLEATVCRSSDAFALGGAAAFTTGADGDARLVVVAEVTRQTLARLDDGFANTLLARARKSLSDIHGLRLADLVLIKPSTLPKTSSGKVRRSHCRALYEAGALDRAPIRTAPVRDAAIMAATLA